MTSLTQRTLFVGREAELTDLRQLVYRAAEGHGSLVLISGEPGIGKTRLLEEVAVQALEAGVLPLVGRCYEAEGTLPYSPFVEALESTARIIKPEKLRQALEGTAAHTAKVAPDLLPFAPEVTQRSELAPEQERHTVFNGVRELLDRLSSERPLFIALEDLHWADDSTLMLLLHLARSVSEMPLILAATYREPAAEDSRPEARPLTRALEELNRARLGQFVTLKPLARGGVGAMLEALSARPAPPAIVDAIYEETEGNPFFVEEVFKHLSEEGVLFDSGGRWRFELRAEQIVVPETVRLVIDRRLKRLTEECRRMLTTAAIIGRDFSFELLEAIERAGDPRLMDAIEEAERARLVIAAAESPEARYRFAHELCRQTLVHRVSLPRRQRLHLRVAQAVERLYGSDIERHTGELARHLYQAGTAADADKTVRYLTLMGERAMVSAAYMEAEQFFRMAHQVLDARGSGDAAKRCELLIELGSAQAKGAPRNEARETLRRAVEAARSVASPELFTRAVLAFPPEVEAGVVDESLVHMLEEALDVLEETDSPRRATTLARLAWALHESNRDTRMAAVSEEALEMARRVGSPSAIAEALWARCASLRGPAGLGERLSLQLEGVQLATQVGDLFEAAEARGAHLYDLLELGDRAAVDVEFEECSRLNERLRDPDVEAMLTKARAMLALLEGHFAEAERLIQDTLMMGRRTFETGALQTFGGQMVALKRELGSLEEVKAALEAFVAQRPTVKAWRCALAFVYAGLARKSEARDEFDRLAVADFADLPRDQFWLLSISMLADVCAFLGDAARAGELYQQLLPYANRNIVIAMAGLCLGSVSRNLGLLAGTMRRWDDAAKHFNDALDMNARIGAKPWLAHTQHEYARMLLTRRAPGDRARAVELLEQALETARALGMKALEERASKLLESHRGLVPRYPDRLTHREAEILRLIAAGRTNREISRELLLSLRTVARHVTNIYGKIGARGKADATAYAIRNNLTQD